MSQKLAVIYRVCNNETLMSQYRPTRPVWFSKFKCFKSFNDAFNNKKVDIHIVFDGDKGDDEKSLFNYISSFPNLTIHEINEKDNKKSLLACYNLASQLNNELISFFEDDYIWLAADSDEDLIDGIKNFGFYTLYLHPDRTRDKSDDITFGHEFFRKTNRGHHVSNESTTYSFGCHRQLFNQFKDLMVKHCNEGIGAPNDRSMWRDLISKGYRLFSPVYASATHCEAPHLADFVDWEKFNAEIIL